MYEIGILTNDRGWQNWRVDSYETAREAYSKACDLCRVIGGKNVALWIWRAGTCVVLMQLNPWGD